MDLAESRLARFQWPVLFTEGDLETEGLDLWDTGWRCSTRVFTPSSQSWLRVCLLLPIECWRIHITTPEVSDDTEH